MRRVGVGSLGMELRAVVVLAEEDADVTGVVGAETVAGVDGARVGTGTGAGAGAGDGTGARTGAGAGVGEGAGT